MKWVCSVVRTVSTCTCSLSIGAGFNHRLGSVGFVVDNVTQRCYPPHVSVFSCQYCCPFIYQQSNNLNGKHKNIKLLYYYIHDLCFW